MSGVFGTLELYGQPHSVYHTKLAATADAGSNTLTLAQSVDWSVSTFFILMNLKLTSTFNFPDFYAVIICMHGLIL